MTNSGLATAIVVSGLGDTCAISWAWDEICRRSAGDVVSLRDDQDDGANGKQDGRRTLDHR
ncbi:hypothetical protein ABIF64_007613 [Bradyrhizobium japonicum]|uniref:hypothetical protein n=1 Tax=Bradyrhizobium japonicum TaxID=375 RepID=UPI0033972D38